MTELNDPVKPVQEFRTEVRCQPLHQIFVLLLLASQRLVAKASIGSRDDHCVLKVNHVTLTIRQPTIVQHLK